MANLNMFNSKTAQDEIVPAAPIDIPAAPSAINTIPTNVATAAATPIPNNIEPPIDPLAVDIANEVVLENEQQKQQQQAVQDLADIKAQTDAKKEAMKSQIAADQAAQAVIAEKTKKDSNDLIQIQNELAKEQDELKKYSIDDVIKDRTTTDKVLASLAIILGGIGQGLMRGGPNMGLQAVDASLEDEFNKQKLGLQEKLNKKQRVYDLLKLKVDTASQQTQDKLKQDQFNLAKQELQLQIDNLKTQREAEKQRQYLENQARTGTLDPNAEAAYVSSLSPEDRKRYVPGFGLAKDSDSAKKALEQINVAEQANMQIQDIRNLFKEFGTREVLDRGAVAQEQSARRNLQLQLKELFNLGVLNGPDLELIEEATGEDFFAITTSDAAKNAKLNSIESFIKQRVNSSLKNAGLNPAGETKRDKIIAKYKENGLSDLQAIERYNKLFQSAK